MLTALLLIAVTATRIQDNAQLLTENELKRLSEEIQKAATERGVQLGLLTVPALGITDTPKSLAMQTLNSWDMGSNSVLVLVSMNPRKLYIQPGAGLAYRFTEGDCVRITRDWMAPGMKAGRYGGAILDGFNIIYTMLPDVRGMGVKQPTTPKVQGPNFIERHPFFSFMLIATGILGILLAVRFWMRKRKEAQAQTEATGARYQRLANEAAQEPANYVAASRPAPSIGGTTVVNNNNDNSLLTGVLLGSALSNSSPQQTTVIREVEHERRHTHDDWSLGSSSDDWSSSSGGGSDWGSSGGGGSDFGGGGDLGGGGSDF